MITVLFISVYQTVSDFENIPEKCFNVTKSVMKNVEISFPSF